MSAIGLYGPVNHFLYAASIILVSGSQMLYGRYLAKDRSRIQSVFSVTILVSLVLSVVTAVLMAAGASLCWTRVFVSEEAALRAFNAYLYGQAPGIPALLVGQQLFAFLSLENQTKRTMAASIACFAANAVMNHLFVAVLRMGTFGLGLSSSVSFWVFLASRPIIIFPAGRNGSFPLAPAVGRMRGGS